MPILIGCLSSSMTVPSRSCKSSCVSASIAACKAAWPAGDAPDQAEEAACGEHGFGQRQLRIGRATRGSANVESSRLVRSDGNGDGDGFGDDGLHQDSPPDRGNKSSGHGGEIMRLRIRQLIQPFLQFVNGFLDAVQMWIDGQGFFVTFDRFGNSFKMGMAMAHSRPRPEMAGHPHGHAAAVRDAFLVILGKIICDRPLVIRLGEVGVASGSPG